MFLSSKTEKKMSEKMCNVLKLNFGFFVRFLVFEVWSILSSTVNWGPEFFAKLIQTLTSEVGDSIQKQ